jgi:thioredoxin reductase
MPNASGDLLGDYDVAIVGGGPAGLTAGIWSARYLHRTIVIDSGDPRNWETRGINGYLGHAGITPAELRGIGRDECRKYGAELLDESVLTIRNHDEHFDLAIEGGTRVTAQRVLLAYGLRDVWPDIPGIARVYGANAHVCPDCDGYEARGKKVVVIGSGRRAVGMALNLTTWTDQIIICTNGKPAELDESEYCGKLDALNIPVLTGAVTRICYDGSRIVCLDLEDGMHLDADKIFFTLAQYPSDDLGAQLGCERDSGGHIVVDNGMHTSVWNVFAAGDLIPGPQLGLAAATDAAIAALHNHNSLVTEW